MNIHPNMISLLNYSIDLVDTKEVILYFEFCPFGELFELLQNVINWT